MGVKIPKSVGELLSRVLGKSGATVEKAAATSATSARKGAVSVSPASKKPPSTAPGAGEKTGATPAKQPSEAGTPGPARPGTGKPRKTGRRLAGDIEGSSKLLTFGNAMLCVQQVLTPTALETRMAKRAAEKGKDEIDKVLDVWRMLGEAQFGAGNSAFGELSPEAQVTEIERLMADVLLSQDNRRKRERLAARVKSTSGRGRATYVMRREDGAGWKRGAYVPPKTSKAPPPAQIVPASPPGGPAQDLQRTFIDELKKNALAKLKK